MNNPNLLSSFADEGTREEVPQNLQQVGYTPTNPNVQGYQLNEMLFQLFGYLNFLKKKGLSAYSTDEDYVAYNETTGIEADIVREGNKIYFAKQDNGKDSPKSPVTNPDYWELFFDFSKPIYTELAKYALSNHKHDTTYAKIGGLSTQKFKVAGGIANDEAVSVAQLKNATNGFLSDNGKSFSENGYQILSNGLIIQWGITTTTTTNFPIAFPNKCLQVNGMVQYSYAGGVNGTYWFITSKSTTSFSTGGDTALDGFIWIAIGY